MFKTHRKNDKKAPGALNRHRKTMMIVEIAGIISVMAIGLSAWIVSSDAVSANSFIGVFTADAQADTTLIDCIDNFAVGSFAFATGYGFVDAPNYTYINTCTITGTADFNVTHAKTVIHSLNSDSRISLTVRFTTSLGSSFSVSNPTLSGGFTNSPTPVAVNLGSYSSAMGFNIVLTASECASAVITGLSFSVTLTYSGALSSFPNIKNETFAFTLIPGEYLL